MISRVGSGKVAKVSICCLLLTFPPKGQNSIGAKLLAQEGSTRISMELVPDRFVIDQFVKARSFDPMEFVLGDSGSDFELKSIYQNCAPEHYPAPCIVDNSQIRRNECLKLVRAISEKYVKLEDISPDTDAVLDYHIFWLFKAPLEQFKISQIQSSDVGWEPYGSQSFSVVSPTGSVRFQVPYGSKNQKFCGKVSTKVRFKTYFPQEAELEVATYPGTNLDLITEKLLEPSYPAGY